MIARVTSGFTAKALTAAGLAMLGDYLFWQGDGFGSNLGGFALIWTVTTLLLNRPAWRGQQSWMAVGAAFLLAASLTDSPGLLGVMLFWSALAMVALLPRFARFDHAGRWVLRLMAHGFTSVIGPWQDLLRLRRHVHGRAPMRRIFPLLPLPLIGGAVFLGLFASANPVIADALSQFGAPEIGVKMAVRILFWLLLITMTWATFRPRRYPITTAVESPQREITLPGISVGSVTLALLTFNALFAMQNGLDLAYLWSAAPLPQGMTLAEYAHRGAYPLIVTALLAGLFVLVALRPGSDTAASPLIRRMVVLWIAQNVFLVASSILRTVDYIEAYSLTTLRIAALIWMVLVALGLILIVWRMLKGKRAAWLINANAAAALLVLTVCSVVDLGSVAAAWNVRTAREAGGQGAELDLCYMNELGPSALVSLVRLERRGRFTPEFASRLQWVRHQVLRNTLAGQVGGEWTWRDARRLSEIRVMLRGEKLPVPEDAAHGRACDGSQLPPPTPVEDSVAPVAQSLTAVDPAVAATPTAGLTNEVAR